MGVTTLLWFVFAFLMLILDSSQGFKFSVGGKDGWVVNPSESYSHWAERNRFQVNDTLFFKFKKGNDSVLVVTRENYNECNTKNPIKSYTEGDCEFKFERSGPHYFISGNADHCSKGQKLVIVVLAVRPSKSPPKPAPTPAPTPAVKPPSPSPAPSASTPAPTPTPATSSPAASGPAPSPGSDADSPTPSGEKSSFAAPVLGSPAMGVVVSVAIGVGLIKGSIVGWV